jgi:hypothetical protein
MLAHESVPAVDTVLSAGRFDSTRGFPGEGPTNLTPTPRFLEDASTKSPLDRKRHRASILAATLRALPAALPPPPTDRRESPLDRKGARVARLALGHDTSMGTGTSPVIPGDRHTKPRSTPVSQETSLQVPDLVTLAGNTRDFWKRNGGC